MKKFLSFLMAAAVSIFSLTTIASAKEEISYPMITTTGIIYLENTAGMQSTIVPDITVADDIVLKVNDIAPNISSVSLEVEGLRYGGNTIYTNAFDFTNYEDVTCLTESLNHTGVYWKLDACVGSAPITKFLPKGFDTIYTLRLKVTGYFETDDEDTYYGWGKDYFKTADTQIFTIVKPFTNHSNITDAIANLVPTIRELKYLSKEVRYDYGFLQNTDFNHDNTIMRNEVIKLSYSERGEGKGIAGFEGLTSQVTTFFNKKTSGTITFKLTTAAPTISNSWIVGGVPSTQIGINGPVRVNDTIMALFFNYDTTGSLMSVGTFSDGQVTFDISGVLGDLNGNIIGTISNIYYCLTGGINFTTNRGLKIQEVILASDDEITEIPVIDTTVTDDDKIDETLEDEDEEDTVEEDEDETVIDTDDDVTLEDDDATLIENEATLEEDEDVNPRTGATLIMFPIVLSGVAVLLSRKRK